MCPDPNGPPFEGNTDFHLHVCTMGIRIEHNRVKIKYAKCLHTVGRAVRWVEQGLVPSWSQGQQGLLEGVGGALAWPRLEPGLGGGQISGRSELWAGAGNKRYLHQTMGKVSCYSINLCSNDYRLPQREGSVGNPQGGGG